MIPIIKCKLCEIDIIYPNKNQKYCSECRKIRQKESSAKHRMLHLEKRRKEDKIRRREKYWNNAQKEREIQSKYRNKEGNREKAKEISKKWRKDNPEKSRLSALISYYKNWIHRKELREKNRDILRKKAQQWAKTHPENVRMRVKKRKAIKMGAIGSHTIEEFINLCDEYKWKCAYCGIQLDKNKITEDHVIALTRGGSNYIENIVPCCASCNSKKHNKSIEEFKQLYAINF